MNENLHELFRTAAKYFFHKYKENGGSLGKLSQQLGTSHTYISAIINGSRTGSLELQSQIAEALYGPYDKFIAAGRRIVGGHKPDEIASDYNQNKIESLVDNLTRFVIQQKDIEKQLAISEQKFQDICLTSSEVIFELNENMTFSYLSDNCYQAIGGEKKEILQKTPFDFLDAEETAVLKSHIEKSISNNLLLDCDVKIMPDGELKYWHITAKPIFSPEGIFKGFRGTCRDVTERKKMIEAVKEQKWLIESIIDSVDQVGIMLTDQNGSVLKWNKHYQKLMDYPDDILATKSLPLYYQYLQDRLSDPSAYKKSITDIKKPDGKTVHFFSFKDGRRIKKTVCPLVRNGILAGCIAHLTEVTEK